MGDPRRRGSQHARVPSPARGRRAVRASLQRRPVLRRGAAVPRWVLGLALDRGHHPAHRRAASELEALAVNNEKQPDATSATLSLEGLWGIVARNPRLFALLGATGLVAGLGFVAARAPSYRARATLILEDSSSSSGLLSDLALFGKAPQASSQIEILRARSTAEQVVDAPDRLKGALVGLGLTTLVEDPLLRPLIGDLRNPAPSGSLPARLEATITCDDPLRAPTEFVLEFLARDRVRVSASGGVCDVDTAELSIANGSVNLAGCGLELRPDGDLTGRSFHVRRLQRDEAIERVMANTRVRETERNSGVIELTVDDSDPRRAAEIANALCRTYLQRSEARGARKATSTLGFIRESLEQQLELLRTAETQVVEVQRQNPRAINVTKSGEILIDQLSGLEVQRVQAQLAREATRDALALLDRGDLAGLARMSGDLADPVTVAYLESLARLDAEHALQDRSDAGPYKLLLQQHEIESQASLDATELELARLRDALRAIESRDLDAIARLGGGPPAARDPLLEGHLTTLGELQALSAEFERETTAEHPSRRENEQRLDATIALVSRIVRSRVDGLEGQQREQLALLSSYRERRAGYPSQERERIDSARAALRRRTQDHLEGRLRGIEAGMLDLLSELERVEASLGTLPEDERVVAEPLRKLAAHTEIVKLLLAREQEAEITRASTQPAAEFVDPAVAPLERSGPSVVLHAALGLLLGMLSAAAAACAREVFSRGIFTESELEAATELPVLGAIPDFRRGRYRVRDAVKHFVPMRDDPEGPTAEAYRSLRANLKFALSTDTDLRTLAVTSCTPGEGKSSSNVALAMTFARSGRRVALIDCDMRCPSVHSYLKLSLDVGLSDVLEGRAAWRDVVRREVGERLDVLTAGKQPHSPGDLLDGATFAQLLQELRSEYDLVICDVPPAIAVSDIESCAARLDAVVLLVRSDRASARLVEQATRRLRQSGANLIGAILNGVGTSFVNGKYGASYGYEYGKRSERRVG
ncbi:MAG: polysaccharide biosynthesis tyrosine autokinase [Planctomycetes bacterium]|nr:polysaccharide biosynthesis tyrosine autokinase [Planctomycetota bacterium]